MNDKKKKKDLIIKILLIVIIILLLVHNCVLINSNKKAKTPSGNVNIIEITCEDSDKCNITNDDNKGNKDKESNDSNTDSNNNISTDTDVRSSGNSEISNGITDNSVDSNDKLSVVDDKIEWGSSSNLKIFTNSFYNLEGKIAPESSNTYQFVIKNSTSYKIKYNISFVETNPYNINMKYKLKKNNTYIVDHYVSYNELNINNQLLNAKSNDTFYLDWKWVSSDNDNDAGENSANYSLKIDIKVESVNG